MKSILFLVKSPFSDGSNGSNVPQGLACPSPAACLGPAGNGLGSLRQRPKRHGAGRGAGADARWRWLMVGCVNSWGVNGIQWDLLGFVGI